MKKSFLIPLAAAILIFIISSNSFADNPWVSIGPDGGYVYTLATHPQTPDTLYAGTDGGVFKGTNDGSDWTAINTGLTNTNISALAIHPDTPDTLYAGTYGGGVFKTTNDGTNWSVINAGLTNTRVTTLAINPQTPHTLYAGTEGGVFKTTNGGTNWIPMNDGLTNTDVAALAINPQAPDILYAVNAWGVFKSTNGGANWINTGLTDNSPLALAINPQTPDTLYAGTWEGVFKSTDGGGNWTPVNAGVGYLIVCALAINPETPDILYAGTPWGVIKSNNGGTNWIPMSNGLPDIIIDSFAINPQTPDILYVGTDGAGVFRIQQVMEYTLTVLKSGTGDGTVTSSPAGINCGDDCSETFTKVQKVKLTAKADANSTFMGWSGGGCTGTKTCMVTVDAAITVTASFASKTPDISVAQTSLDFGSVKLGKKVTKTLKITNNGSGDLWITLSGIEETDFSIQGSSSITIKARKSYSLKVLFTPGSGGLRTATLKIESNDPDTPTIDISLSGIAQ